MSLLSRYLFVVTLVAFVVVILGAYVRLSNAGLGCPDWPGCYGRMIVSADSPDADLVKERPLEFGKALREMVHRYAAGTLGLLILVLALVLRTPLSFLLLGLVVFQAALGMWTVTLKLHPFVVMAHLLGGFGTLSLLWWLTLSFLPRGNHAKQESSTRCSLSQTMDPRPNSPLAAGMTTVALFILILQIALGGWMSANYASVACPDFPTCHGEWWPSMNFREAFLVWREIGINYEWGILESVPRTTIHMMHRFGAVLTFLLLLFTALRYRKKIGIVLAVLLILQMTLGLLNVLLHLPLAVAVTHNAVAALLLLSLITLLWTSTNSRQSMPV